MNNPYARAVDIVLSNTANFSEGFCDAIFVGGAGIVEVVFQDDSVVDFTCVAGQILPVKAKRVNSTGTSASLLRALRW